MFLLLKEAKQIVGPIPNTNQQQPAEKAMTNPQKKELALNSPLPTEILVGLHESADTKITEIAKDLSLAKLASWMQIISATLSVFNPKHNSRSYEVPKFQSSSQTNLMSFFQDLFLRFRMMAQMSLHAKKGGAGIPGDDIAQCELHNISARKLGQLVYKFHAFWSVPSLLAQKIIFGTDSPFSRALSIVDRVMRMSTNIFWNMRRITLGMLPYINHELITSTDSEAYKKFSAVSKPIKTLMAELSARFSSFIYLKIHKTMPPFVLDILGNYFGFSLANLRREYTGNTELQHQGRLRDLFQIAVTNLQANIKAFMTGKHKSILSGEIQDISQEEPDTPPWYLKSKLFASILNPFVGISAFGLNSLSMLLGVVGEIFQGKNTHLLSLAQNLSDISNGAMSSIYLLGEVFAHASKMQQAYRRSGEIKYDNLTSLTIGSLGMGWRLVKSIFAALAIPGMHFQKLGETCNKVLHSRLDNILDPLFLLFFSVNRVVSHGRSLENEGRAASEKAKSQAAKSQEPLAILSLIFKILFRDSQLRFDNN